MIAAVVFLLSTCLCFTNGLVTRTNAATSLATALIRAPPAKWAQPIPSKVYSGVDIDATTKLGVQSIDQAAREGADLVAFPELWFPGTSRNCSPSSKRMSGSPHERYQ